MSEFKFDIETVVFDHPVYVHGQGRKDTFTIKKGTAQQWVSTIWSDGDCVWLEHSGRTMVVPHAHVFEMFPVPKKAAVTTPEVTLHTDATVHVAAVGGAEEPLPQEPVRRGRHKKVEA